MKQVHLLLIALLYSFSALPITISGHLSDARTGETLINASIFEQLARKGTVSNTYGFYSLTLPGPTVSLRFSYVGYGQQFLTLSLKHDTVLNIKLVPSNTLKEVTVLGNSTTGAAVKETQMSAVQIPASQIRSIPSLLGETDLIKALQLLPGVQAGTEGSAGMYVRGGGPDENLLLLDGVPVYNVNHLFGFFSVFNTDAIKNVTLYKGNFPARFGGRLSSVVDIRMNDGNDQSIHGNFSIGLVSSKFNLEGPISKGKTTFNVSLRRTYADLLVQPIIKIMDAQDGSVSHSTAGYYFYDFNGKISHRLSDKDRLYLSYYMGDDAIYANYREHLSNTATMTDEGRMKLGWNWGNLISALRWNHVINNKLFMNTTATFTRYRFDMDINYREKQTQYTPHTVTESKQELGYQSGIRDYGLKSDFEYAPSPDHEVKFGGAYTHHTFRPGVSVAKVSNTDTTAFAIDTMIGDRMILSNELQLYAEDNMSLGDYIKANLGVHYSAFDVQGQFYQSVEPRLGLRFLLSDRLSAKAGFATMNQYIHLLSNNNISLPTDLWVPVTKRIPPMKSMQVSAGLFYNLLDVADLSIEGYYKTMDNLIEYKDGASFMSSSTGWEDKVCLGNGRAYGLEFLIQKSYGKTTGWLGYTWSKAERTFDRPGQVLNGGRTFPAKYDRRHDVSLTLSHKLSDRIDISGTWVYYSGNCATMALHNYEGPTIPDTYGYGTSSNGYINSRNNYRFNAYHRMDIGINFHKKKKHGTRTWNISAYNVYNQYNPFIVYPNTVSHYDPISGKSIITTTLRQVSLFPIIPSISYSYSF